MPGKPVRIGPFVDGLNNVSLSGESKDTELVEMINFEVGPDNLLWSRPPFEIADTTTIDGSTVTDTWKTLGVYRSSNSQWYAIVIKPKAGGASEIQAYLSGDFTSAPIVIKSIASGNTVTAYVQMNADAYFTVSPASTISCFKWTGGGSTADVTAMKKGFSLIAFQSRLWVAGIDTAVQNSRVYFSAIGTGGATPDVWNSVDFFDAAPGEGGFITALLAVNGNILVFKNDGTWRFSYPASPSKGQVIKLSGSVGAATATSVVEFENYVYIYDQGKVYELVNNTFTQLNRFVRFDKDLLGVDSLAPGVDISIFNRRLVVRYFNTVYAYSIDSRAWSQWRSYKGTPGRMHELPSDSASTASSIYMAASMGTAIAVNDNVIPAFTESYATLLASEQVMAGNTVSSVGTTIQVDTPVSSDITLAERIPLSAGQKWKLTGNSTNTGGVFTALLKCLLRSGATTTISYTMADIVNTTFTVPNTTVYASLHIVHTGTDVSYTINGLQFSRLAGPSPVAIMTVKDEYNAVPLAVELIVCRIRTKSYDFQVPSSMKRLFYWGADIKTSQWVTARLIPNAIKLPPTWGKLREYTHAQLASGTWGNPLSFLVTSLDIIDGGDPKNAVTENGRIFAKFVKSIRFKQLSFSLETSTLGTQATGPCKIHTLTAYVMPKEKVVDKFN